MASQGKKIPSPWKRPAVRLGEAEAEKVVLTLTPKARAKIASPWKNVASPVKAEAPKVEAMKSPWKPAAIRASNAANLAAKSAAATQISSPWKPLAARPAKIVSENVVLTKSPWKPLAARPAKATIAKDVEKLTEKVAEIKIAKSWARPAIKLEKTITVDDVAWNYIPETYVANRPKSWQKRAPLTLVY